jgi:hypothetical protein
LGYLLRAVKVPVDEEAVIFLDGAAQHFEDDDQQHDADAGAGEDALGGDLP